MKVQAVVARDAEGPFTLEELELDAPQADEILVKIAGVGLCHTDLVLKSAGPEVYPFPAVFGHEGSGIVEAVGGQVTKVAPGDRVAITFRSCGDCDRCSAGDAPYCRTFPLLNFTGRRADQTMAYRSGDEPVAGNFFGQSSFGSHALTYERNVVKVPDDLPLELVGPLGCGIQTGFGGVVRSLKAKPQSSILILGGGAVGLSAVMGAKVQQCSTIIVLEPHAGRRALAQELGATHVIDPAAGRALAESVREIAPMGVDYALDTTGIPEVLKSTMGALGSKAVFGIIGVAPPGTPVPGEISDLITFGYTIQGIIEGDSDPDTFIPEMMEHYRAGRMPFDKMIKTYPLSEINQAIADQAAGECVKVVLLPQV
ncbi:MAG: NAD(P)-dependent alcohol dehydrogenase [Pseudomonadales bacterium]